MRLRLKFNTNPCVYSLNKSLYSTHFKPKCSHLGSMFTYYTPRQIKVRAIELNFEPDLSLIIFSIGFSLVSLSMLKIWSR